MEDYITENFYERVTFKKKDVVNRLIFNQTKTYLRI